ncbi:MULTISPECIES: coenzyme F420-0:L-glutamate ligase [unclassified Bradyrhizobium]|uniref:coenzyme F420-0:L-glutamate ligase n=1 Tax=unclassified Bradyrhizobium TaxID=2631580 RepID=UPI001CD54050|nr:MULTISPECIES: coenzyme F420-0:L-glutamate ligase [unclassified Bradyrhizobium]MCA1386404.1 coenzyme F420-0:L-glutamate ligase [Bradyrhizobium sp. BRP05]MCA1394507.1 coenzyme F420-0:L-glutamate ligase [Bradyrhizobium sp. IC3123]MCA1424000.1 coenzyme F420-0:L-glutamate ligase [Bradyrhizobium sp. BRP23]MCA1431022.1 coenzyme F420-0:L-glutamate ligase [Bradyrhizobium sp. NBAIM16]MCA1436385.1 coenzyme F420-0:L-glutamate ligase [Bradyrhizobium sp. BRP20]
MTRSITYSALPGIPLVGPGDDLVGVIADGAKTGEIAVASGDIFVVAQKIVSKAENRYVYLDDVRPSDRAVELAKTVGKDPRHIEVVLSESTEVLRARQNVIIVVHRLGFVMANAGIDESNIEQDRGHRVLLLPEDPDDSCRHLKRGLDRQFGVDVGVIINDSFGRPWRNGVVGVALGSAGIPALQSMIGKPDLFGRPMQVTEIAVADELAAAASLLMGQAAEGQPVIHVRGFSSRAPINSASALVRAKERDMFR